MKLTLFLHFDMIMVCLLSEDQTVGACYTSLRYAIYQPGVYIVLNAPCWLLSCIIRAIISTQKKKRYSILTSKLLLQCIL
jgi:hypothetical protein